MIPPLDARGLLPPGVHDADLEGVPPLFCTNAHRHRLWDDAVEGLDLLCDVVRVHPDHCPALVLGGSFFSDKATPGDIEATFAFAPGTPPDRCWFWAMQHAQLHAMLKAQHRLDFYPSLPGQNDFTAFFQYVGPKTAQAKGLDQKALRGALRVQPW